MTGVAQKFIRWYRSLDRLSDATTEEQATANHRVQAVKRAVISSGFRRLPYAPRSVIVIDEGAATRVKYYFDIRGRISLTSVDSLDASGPGLGLRIEPQCPVILGWDKFIASRLELQGLSESELSTAIPLQLALCSPFGPDEVVYAVCRNRPSNVKGQCVDVDYVQGEGVVKQLSPWVKNGFCPSQIYTDLHVWETYLATLNRQGGNKEGIPTIFVHLKQTSIRMLRIVDNRITDSRSVLTSNAAGEDAYSTLSALLLEHTGKHSGEGLSSVLIAGSDESLKDIKDGFGKGTKVSVTYLEPDALLPPASLASASRVSAKEVPPAFLAWLACHHEHLPVLEPSQSLRGPFLKRFIRSQFVGVGALVLTLVLVWIAAMQVEIFNVESQLEEVQVELARTEPTRRRLAKMGRELDQAGRISGDGESVLDVLHSLTQAKPKDVQLANLSYVRGDRLSVGGQALNPNAPVDYVKSLESDSIFESVDLKYISSEDIGRSSVVTFQLEIGLGQ